MEYSWTVRFCITSSHDSNLISLFSSVQATAKSHKESCRGNMEPDEGQECCVRPRKSVKNVSDPGVILADIRRMVKPSVKTECTKPMFIRTSSWMVGNEMVLHDKVRI
ncbi:hypothetical protein BsWGS_24864 [Bradybaena similaris]